MSLLFRLKMAKQSGEKLLRDDGITTLPVDPMAIADSRGIAVRAKPETAGGVSGMLVRNGNMFGILYATHVKSEGFQRFSVAHELGHYFLDGHVDHILPKDGIHTSQGGFISADPYEMEADQFAAGLLMPEALCRPVFQGRDPGLAAIEYLANRCKTSLTATAIRFAELTRDAVAVIISTGGVVDYCFMSDAMKSLPKLEYIRKGLQVPVGTATADFSADAYRVLAGDRVAANVNSDDWLGGTERVVLDEEVVGLGFYGKTLTVLSSKSFALADEGYEDEAQEERDLIESYTPRFRK